MPTEPLCPECQSAIPHDANTGGLCPRCLLKLALGDEGPAAAGFPPFTPPEPAELTAQFPDLQVMELIGRGGMGAVYKARQRSLDRIVAVKVFPLDYVDDPAFVERFHHEARVLAKLDHPRVVAAYEFGRSDRYCYFVMQFVSGPTLREVLAGGPMPPRAALDLAAQVCEALDYAHRSGVVHRDLKPENILLDSHTPHAGAMTPSGRVRVADFGLAKLTDAHASGLDLTAPGERFGTMHYMAPEQLEGTAIDHRADIYAVGVLLYEMLTARLPIGRFPPPSHLASVAASVDAVVLRCLEANPQQRFQSAADLRDALWAATVSSEPRSHRRALWVTAAAVACIGLGASMVARSTTDAPPPTAAAPNDLGPKLLDWIASNAAAQVRSGLTADAASEVVPAIRSGVRFQWRLGPDLVNSARPTVLTVQGGELFAVELDVEAGASLGIAGATAMFVQGGRHTDRVGPRELSLHDPTLSGALALGADGRIAGAVTIRGFNRAGRSHCSLRLTYLLPTSRVEQYHHVADVGVADELRVSFEFDNPARDAADALPCVAFLEVGTLAEGDGVTAFTSRGRAVPIVLTLHPPGR